jgi:hypothetical protein
VSLNLRRQIGGGFSLTGSAIPNVQICRLGQFPWRWNADTISLNLGVIWKVSG